MPGLVMMENGMQNGLAQNHDRDTNGAVNGGSGGDVSHGSAASAGPADQQHNGVGPLNADAEAAAKGYTTSSRLNDLPDEIQHITEGYIPLGLLISRLAQKTHNRLEEKMLELAKMPAPNPVINGSVARPGAPPDDVSVETLNKKTSLLKFVQDTHADWVKALIIAAWSRRAETVSKLLDLKGYIEKQRDHYGGAMEYLMNVKRSLTFAQLPNPDLQTALQVLSTGEAPWIPDLGYIEPPPLTLAEQMQWMEEINTLLSLRLNIEDHDKIPSHFRDYTINSGRVTFRVAGEFEVDLTIADEDFEKQYWFIDFRFSFSPAPAELTDILRQQLEMRVNEALEKNGLQGCFDFLHEYVLTHKITEFVRQALELTRGRWVDTLKVERLNRAMSIQYWTSRLPPDAPKSWIILGVNSGKKSNSTGSSSSTSHLTLRWFRDGKEVKLAPLALDDVNISTETLLKHVIAQHVGHILTTVHGKFMAKGRFVNREASLSVSISPREPVESVLKMQLNNDDSVSLQVAPVNGFFSITPQTALSFQLENKLNWQSRDPAEEGMNALESLRCQFIRDKVHRRGTNVGWTGSNGPVKPDAVKAFLQNNEHFFPVWLRKTGWPQGWHVLLKLSPNGDRLHLVEV
jgi:mediator of RNA polymerase II transcription subunit 14